MKLYIMRHGEAADAADDDARPLTERGLRETRKVAERLKRSKYIIDIIQHSNKLRAVETARCVGEVYREAGLSERKGIRPNDPVDSIADELSFDFQDKHLMLVSHLPFVGLLTSRLLSGSADDIPMIFSVSSVAVLSRSAETGWTLEEIVSP